MSKQCARCYKITGDNDKFCPYCGSDRFFAGNPDIGSEDQTVMVGNGYGSQQNHSGQNYGNTGNNQQGYGQQGYNQQNYGQPVYNQQSPNPSYGFEPKKKKHTGLIIALVVIGVVVLFFIIAVLALIGSESEDTNGIGTDITAAEATEEETTEEESTTAAIAYTKGSFEGNIYKNEWANIKFTAPDGYYEASSDFYSSLQTEGLDYGVWLVSGNANQIIVGFDNVASFVSESIYLASEISSMEDSYNDYAEQGITAEANDDFKDIEIAGETFKYYTTTFTSVSEGITCTTSEYVRIYDGKAIGILIYGDSEEANNAIVSAFTTCQ
ncbi:MAG: NOB1 family endonuclease [Clostridiales bacterium]|nr:NOB1 family endonuclease [Clostridiales bacterium]